MVLARNRNYFQIFFASLSPMAFVLIILAELQFEWAYSLAIIILCYLASLIFWFKNASKPAAWITKSKLHIRDGVFGTDIIHKDLLESMRYEIGHKRAVAGSNAEEAEMHILVIKMKGFDEWTLPIKDLVEHGPNLRLYKFIRDNFYNLKLVKR
ncbi:hypothetical protein [Pseudoalteromonas atlantica]|uniref:hypothetical protein n=1 Tax=Pseudoalteromonas atlantica TaxID=288 RepID=UPI003735CECD